MSEIPARIWAWPRGLWNVGQTGTAGGTLFVRADVHESERALNAELVEALELVTIWHSDDADADEKLIARGIDPPWAASDLILPRLRAALAKAEVREKGD